jgi:hypothetical protein
MSIDDDEAAAMSTYDRPRYLYVTYFVYTYYYHMNQNGDATHC